MPRIVIESGLVINMGGYIIENMAKLDCLDIVIGNPMDKDIKIKAPLYDMSTLDEYESQGLIVEKLYEGEMLKDKLEKVKEMVGERKVTTQ